MQVVAQVLRTNAVSWWLTLSLMLLTIVQVLNPGFAPITVHKDEIIGMLKPIQDPAGVH